MKTTVNKIVPHEDSGMEVHVEFRDHETRGPVVNVVVFVEKQDHPLSKVRSLAIKKALEFLPQVTQAEQALAGVSEQTQH